MSQLPDDVPRAPSSRDASARDTEQEDLPRALRAEDAYALPDWSPDCEPPGSTRLGRYTVQRRIGRGGMGMVYEAFDEDRGERVALKTMRAHDVRSVSDLKREFRIASELTHRNLVTLYELAVEGDIWFFTMEYVDGTDLMRYVRRLDATAADYDRLRDVARQLTLGLITLHAHGLLHQDIKPSNILIDRQGRVVLLDFGLASRAGRDRDEWGRKVAGWGTRAYLAPERALGAEMSPASDWFSVGAVLYEAMTGRVPPRKADDKLKLLAPEVDFERLAFDGSMPADLVALTKRLLASNPARRAVEADVVTALGMESLIGGETSTSPPSVERFVGRRRELQALASAYAQAEAGGTVVVHVRGPSGLGKTALVRHFLATLDAPAAPLVLDGRCYELESVPYKGFEEIADALTRFLCRLDGATVAQLLPEDGHLLGRIFPVLRRVPELDELSDKAESGIDPHRLRRRAFRALKALLGSLAQSRPTILVLDDLQWSDRDTFHLLSELVSGPAPSRLMVIMSYRSDGGVEGPMLRELERHHEGHGATQAIDILLDALPMDDAASLGRVLAGARYHPALAEAIAHEAAGSPFLIELLARHVGGTARPSLEQVLRDELEQLDEPARRLLEVVVMAGRPIAQEIALRAAHPLGDPRAALAQLRSRNLVRTMGHLLCSNVEVYHDAIRTSMLQLLDAATRRTHHAALAVALEAVGHTDPEALARHHHGAGNSSAAARYAARAAAAAADKLAFDRAAALYALACECDPLVRDELSTKRAEALAHAGRGGESAELFLASAERGGDRLDLRRRAAEQYMISGRIAAGVATLEPVLESVGLSYPRAPWLALASIVKNLAFLAVRGTRFTPRPASEIDRDTTARLAVCFSAGRGLVSCDPLRGSDYMVQGTLLALEAGDAAHVARGLSYVGLMYVYQGGARSIERGYALMEEGERVARRCGDLAAQGWVGTVRGLASTSIGAWRASIEEIDESVALMRSKTVGTHWEQIVGLTTALLSLAALGQLETLRRRASELEQEAIELGDRLASVEASLYLALVDVAVDRPTRARRRIHQAMARWIHDGFHFQHWTALRYETYCDLYEGAEPETVRRLERGVAAARAARLLDNQIVRGESALLEGFVGLALLARGHRELARIERAASRLARERRAWCDAGALVLRAGLAGHRGDRDGVIAALRKAREAYHAADMPLHAAAAKLRLGEVLPGSAGSRLVDEAVETLRGEGVAKPDRWCNVFAPVFLGDTRSR